MNNINHNNHIQSLRAIAVISVMLFHTNQEIFSTGYLGVDIFFVISGYLICKVLSKYEKINFVLLFDFYIRRARRTLPALLALILISIPFFLTILMPVNLIDFSQSLIATPIFLSNFLFGSENDYWGSLSELKPFLHTWSLAIEWQFYLSFPLIFFFKKRLTIFVILFLISILTNIFINFNDLLIFIDNHKVRLDNFFFTTNRIWEFLAGSILYLFEQNSKLKIKKSKILSLLGLSLIFASFYFFEKSLRFNTYWNLIPVIGTCLFIYFTDAEEQFKSIYKNKLLLHIGLISYSLYLWHQPILAYFKNLFNNNIPNYYYLLIYVFIYLFSIFSFYLFEKPFYEKKILKNKTFVSLTFLIILFIISIGFLISTEKINIKNSIEKKITKIEKTHPKLKTRDLAQKRGILNGDRREKFEKNFTDSEKIKVYINGDSHSRDLFLILFNTKKTSQLFEFSIKDFDNADVVLYHRQFYEETIRDLEQHTIIKKAIANNKKIIIVSRSPEFYSGNISPLIYNLIQNQNNLDAYNKKDKKFIDHNFYQILRDDVLKINKKLKIKASKLEALYLDRFDIACDMLNKSCHSMTLKGHPLYWDHSHLTWQGVYFFSNLVDETKWFDEVSKFLNRK